MGHIIPQNMELALYRKLQNDIKSLILSGIYKEGDLLPSEHELRAIHDVTRTTVRQALDELVKEGYIVKIHGKRRYSPQCDTATATGSWTTWSIKSYIGCITYRKLLC